MSAEHGKIIFDLEKERTDPILPQDRISRLTRTSGFIALSALCTGLVGEIAFTTNKPLVGFVGSIVTGVSAFLTTLSIRNSHREIRSLRNQVSSLQSQNPTHSS